MSVSFVFCSALVWLGWLGSVWLGSVLVDLFVVFLLVFSKKKIIITISFKLNL